MARNGTNLLKHILITSGLGAALAIAASSASAGEAHAQSCDHGQVTYATPSYTAPAVHITPVNHNHYQAPAHDYRVERRRDARQRRRMIRRMFRGLDYNRDGFLSRYEARRHRMLRHRFRWIDRDRDGYLSRRELNQHLRRQQRRGIL